MPKGITFFSSLVQKTRRQRGVKVILANASGKRLTVSAEGGESRMTETTSVSHAQELEGVFEPNTLLYFWQENTLIGECQLPPQAAAVHVRIGPGGVLELQ